MILARLAFETVKTNPRSYHPNNATSPDSMAIDNIFTPDGKRIWCNFSGEQGDSKIYPLIREDPFHVIGYINLEASDNTTLNALTICGNVIRTIHRSRFSNPMLGEILEPSRLLSSDETNYFIAYIQPILEQ